MKPKPMLLTLLIALAFLLVACVPNDGRITIEDPWARSARKGNNSAIYLLITSNSLDDALVKAEVQLAGATEMHRSMMTEEGTMKMEPQHQILLPEGETVELAPGGLHIMLIGLEEDLLDGETLNLTLTFQHHPELVIDVPVQNP